MSFDLAFLKGTIGKKIKGQFLSAEERELHELAKDRAFSDQHNCGNGGYEGLLAHWHPGQIRAYRLEHEAQQKDAQWIDAQYGSGAYEILRTQHLPDEIRKMRLGKSTSASRTASDLSSRDSTEFSRQNSSNPSTSPSSVSSSSSSKKRGFLKKWSFSEWKKQREARFEAATEQRLQEAERFRAQQAQKAPSKPISSSRPVYNNDSVGVDYTNPDNRREDKWHVGHGHQPGPDPGNYQ